MHLNASQFLRTDTSFVEDEKKKLSKDDQDFKVSVVIHFRQISLLFSLIMCRSDQSCFQMLNIYISHAFKC